ncbi:hypothetical protein EUGRSUZ_A01017 [Eucalyptus grandis]|uniref:Uncharacterized protein n=2 Tax=Eucalyptus grandis TaxID=71139 RepID=A0ACC3M3S9_EUCGR|nr:hypothetical protein EUGRSUZ_A01017 [Eucalyptus grandis]
MFIKYRRDRKIAIHLQLQSMELLKQCPSKFNLEEFQEMYLRNVYHFVWQQAHATSIKQAMSNILVRRC